MADQYRQVGRQLLVDSSYLAALDQYVNDDALSQQDYDMILVAIGHRYSTNKGNKLLLSLLIQGLKDDNEETLTKVVNSARSIWDDLLRYGVVTSIVIPSPMVAPPPVNYYDLGLQLMERYQNTIPLLPSLNSALANKRMSDREYKIIIIVLGYLSTSPSVSVNGSMDGGQSAVNSLYQALRRGDNILHNQLDELMEVYDKMIMIDLIDNNRIDSIEVVVRSLIGLYAQ